MNSVLDKPSAYAHTSADGRIIISCCERSPQITASEMSTLSLIEHILGTHHKYLHTVLPRLTSIAEHACDASGGCTPHLPTIAAAIGDFRSKIEPHMLKEEAVLFPAIRQLENTGTMTHRSHAAMGNCLRIMIDEHAEIMSIVERLRALTHDYSTSSIGCLNCRLLIRDLESLEADTIEHILEENDLLFPRSLALLDRNPG